MRVSRTKYKSSITSKEPIADKSLYSSLKRSWWVMAFCVVCAMFYSHAAGKKRGSYSELQTKLDKYNLDKRLALQEHEDLLLQMSSQNDPAWIEMTLKKRLGMVPEGQMKVYFKKEEAP